MQHRDGIEGDPRDHCLAGVLGLVTALVLVAPNAGAQEQALVKGSTATTELDADPGSVAASPPANVDDPPRIRLGVAGAAGPLFVEGLPAAYTGVELRVGSQLSELVAVYLQPQLGGYLVPGLGAGALVGISGLVDFTFHDRLFVGAGVGYATLIDLSGVEAHIRAGGYPLASASALRKGLSVALEFRVYVGLDPGIAPTISVGYDLF